MKKILCFISITIFLLGCEKNSSLYNTSSPTSTGTGGSMARFTVDGNYLYTVDRENLNVYDISTPAEPVFKRTIPVGFEIETIFPFNGKLFIGSSSMIYIFSLEDPANPQQLSTAISPAVMRRCDPVVAKDTVAYATLRSNGPCGGDMSFLAVYNIKDVTRPYQTKLVQVSEPYGLGYENDVLYVCDKYQLKLFDISQAYDPKFLKSLSDGTYVDVIPYGDVLFCYVTDGLIIYNITDNKNPILLTYIK